jgi:hypothetical protein
MYFLVYQSVSNVAPAGIRVVVTVLPLSAGVDRDTAGVDTLLRYQVVLRVDCAFCSEGCRPFFSCCFVANDASFASEERCRLRAISSRQALASLSTRAGRFASRSKLIEQRALVVGAGGGGGAVTVTEVVCRCSLSLVVNHVAGHRDRSRCCTNRAQRRGGAAAGSNQPWSCSYRSEDGSAGSYRLR